jgi:glycerol-3-phosphate dehydrogenase subunit C
MVEQGEFSPRLRFRNNLIARSELLGKVGSSLAPLANTALSNRLIRLLMDQMLRINKDAPLPRFSNQRFRHWFFSRPNALRSEQKVAYFHGCSTEYYEPRIGKAAVQVLESNGFEVIVPPQNCCGLPLLSNGEFPAAQRYHRSNVRKMSEYARNGIPIIGTSTSCTLTLKEEAPELLELDSDDVQCIAEHTYDFNEFLVHLLERGKFNTNLSPIPFRLAYHAPCQYRAHRIGNPTLDLMNLIPGLQLIDSRATCCGIAGTYGYKSEKYQIGMDVGEPLFNFIRTINSPLVVCESETCRWQITHATGIPAIHPVELLAYSYGYTPEGALASRITKQN